MGRDAGHHPSSRGDLVRIRGSATSTSRSRDEMGDVLSRSRPAQQATGNRQPETGKCPSRAARLDATANAYRRAAARRPEWAHFPSPVAGCLSPVPMGRDAGHHPSSRGDLVRIRGSATSTSRSRDEMGDVLSRSRPAQQATGNRQPETGKCPSRAARRHRHRPPSRRGPQARMGHFPSPVACCLSPVPMGRDAGHHPSPRGQGFWINRTSVPSRSMSAPMRRPLGSRRSGWMRG